MIRSFSRLFSSDRCIKINKNFDNFNFNKCNNFCYDRIQNKPGLGVNPISTLVFPLQFKASPALWAEPLKKKKKIDPMLIKLREERKKKRIMKEIRKLQKLDKQLKPIIEFEIPVSLTNELERRKRRIQVSDAAAEERTLLLKEWAKTKFTEGKNDSKTLIKLLKAQKKALDELRLESEELYQAAVKIDSNLVPFSYTGPTETPLKEGYQIPDGNYIDVSKKWGL